MEATVEAPETITKEALPYSEQEVRYYYGGWYETTKRDEVVKRHLEWIDPILLKWADKFGPNPGQIKDISHPDYLSPENPNNRVDELEPKDLVLVHLTDTFPEDGIIRPTNHFRPEVLRYSLHFTVNTPVPEEAAYGVGKWPRKKYAILIPFEKVMDRIDEFRPGDTIIMDELELPEGSLILAGRSIDLPKDSKMAGQARTAIENFGNSSSDLRLAINRAILSEGYCPMPIGSHDNWAFWFSKAGNDTISEFVDKNNLKYGSGHAYHWSHELEGLSGDFLRVDQENNPQVLKSAIYDANQFIERRQDVPQKYKDKLKQLVEKNQQKAA